MFQTNYKVSNKQPYNYNSISVITIENHALIYTILLIIKLQLE